MHKINICPAWMTEFLILRLAGGCSKIALHLIRERILFIIYTLIIYVDISWWIGWLEQTMRATKIVQTMNATNYAALHGGRRKTEECEL